MTHWVGGVRGHMKGHLMETHLQIFAWVVVVATARPAEGKYSPARRMRRRWTTRTTTSKDRRL